LLVSFGMVGDISIVEALSAEDLHIINDSSDPEYEKLMRMIISGYSEDGIGCSSPQLMQKLSAKSKEDDKQENHETCNPILYATIVKGPKGEDIFLKKESYLQILHKLPVDIWIDGKPPHESPIVARADVGKIIVCPYEPGRKDLNSHATFAGGVPGINLQYSPTKYGCRDYKLSDRILETENCYTTGDAIDFSLNIVVLFEHFPRLLTYET
jgi:hypothetical protein